MKPIIFVLCFVALTISCKDDKGSSSGRNYEIPRFAVYPLSESGIATLGGLGADFLPLGPNKGLKYLVLAPINFLLPPIYAQSLIDCEEEVALNNAAPQTFGRAADISAKDLIHRFYAQAIFYDCVTRQQSQSFGVGETVESDPDNEGEEVTILTAKNIGSDEEVLTQYVSWTDLPESENVRGRLVNKYVQNDGIITKTRVDLKIINGAREVTSMLHFIDISNGSAKLYSKAGFRESDPDEDGNFQEQEVWGRFYDTTNKTIVQVRATVGVGSGFSVELKRCFIEGENIDTDCSSASSTTEHYNADGDKASNGAVGGFSGISEEISFYGGQSEEQYFTPEFSLE